MQPTLLVVEPDWQIINEKIFILSIGMEMRGMLESFVLEELRMKMEVSWLPRHMFIP
jgi:hypothetical protein